MTTASPPARDTFPELGALYRILELACTLSPGMPSQRLQCLLHVLGQPSSPPPGWPLSGGSRRNRGRYRIGIPQVTLGLGTAGMMPSIRVVGILL